MHPSRKRATSVPILLKENVAMRTSDFEPLYRSTVGFDRLFDMLDATSTSTRPDWPPYNIERKSEHEYRITMALAGFRPDEIELTQQGNNLLVIRRQGRGEARKRLRRRRRLTPTRRGSHVFRRASDLRR
jgi:HSP20 family molecular chaperone IbpA